MGYGPSDLFDPIVGGVDRRWRRLVIHRSPHAQTGREIEVLINVYDDGREAVVFHAMGLGPKYRRYREENPNG